MSSKKLYNLTLTGFFIALGIILPQITGRIPDIGKLLSPMHFPVLICGCVCGWKYAGACGILTPILTSLIFQRPVLFPMAVCMLFELATCGIVIAVLYKMLKNSKLPNPFPLYISLVSAMISGRIVYAIAKYICLGFSSSPSSIFVFFIHSFSTAWIGIILQIVIIPPIILILNKIMRKYF